MGMGMDHKQERKVSGAGSCGPPWADRRTMANCQNTRGYSGVREPMCTIGDTCLRQGARAAYVRQKRVGEVAHAPLVTGEEDTYVGSPKSAMRVPRHPLLRRDAVRALRPKPSRPRIKATIK